ncbi:hypothetical protein KY290_001212 [Solanum tuberosum]|uniref:F-box associated domain-containing protein n=1 Tax=Solanum tuberosum TaxID=4113 RepID=A0ABQ7WLJ3_SOLTU|nr:hypothetical protein KY290_001212 [Solanum tuberosum]
MAMSIKLPDEMIEEIVSWMSVKSEDVAFLINPTTLEYRRIPNSPLALPKRGTSTAGVLEGDLLCTFVDVYSARMGFWRILESISHNGAIPIHDEKFFEVPIPTITTTSLLRFYGIVALKGCLCVLGDRRNENEIDVWMMKEYGVVESWTKFSVVRNTFPFCPTPVCLICDDDIILSAPGKVKLIIYNKKKEQQREMNVDGKTSKCIRIRTFMESLVSLMIGRETEGSDYIA